LKQKEESKLAATNRKARHLYHIEETYEAGISLSGCEIKSLREGKASIQEAYARIDHDEVWLVDAHISPFEKGSYQNLPPKRKRRLLLNKSEIRKLKQQVERKGYTLVPLKIYFNSRGWAKVEIGVAKGKKIYDRREDIKEKIQEREIERGVKIFHWQREELLAGLTTLDPEILEKDFPGQRWNILGIAKHIANAELWYLSRLDLTDLSHKDLSADPKARLGQTAALIDRVFPKFINEVNVAGIEGEFWSYRKILRRTLWHQRDHIEHIKELIQV